MIDNNVDKITTDKQNPQKEPWITRLKRFLVSNKIFFETIMTLSLSIAGVFLSVSSNKIARIQNEIIAAQRDIEIEASNPIIDLECEYDEEGKIKKVDVLNTGGLLDTLDVTILPYVHYGLTLLEPEKKNMTICNAFGKGSKVEYNKPVIFLNNYSSEKALYKTYTSHIKTGVLLSVQLSEHGNYVKELVATGMPIRVFFLDRNGGVFSGHPNSENDAKCYVLPVSFEYLINIRYSSLVNDDIKTEVFRVIPGISRWMSDYGIKKININDDDYQQYKGILNGESPLIINEDFYQGDEYYRLYNIQEYLVNNSEFELIEEKPAVE